MAEKKEKKRKKKKNERNQNHIASPTGIANEELCEASLKQTLEKLFKFLTHDSNHNIAVILALIIL